MIQKITKAIIPIAGLGTRFLPISSIIAKEFLPIGDNSVIEHIVQEVIDSGIKDIVFVINENKKYIFDYFNNAEQFKGIKFSCIKQSKPLGDGNAILQAVKLIKENPAAVMFGDDVVESNIPALSQLINIYNHYQKPIIGLFKLPTSKLSSYGVAEIGKVTDRLFKIKKIVEKPKRGEEPSNLAIVGKYILTPLVFKYLENYKKNTELILTNVFNEMLKSGEDIYGYQIDGKWLECGNKTEWLKSSVYLSLKDKENGLKLKNFIVKNGLL